MSKCLMDAHVTSPPFQPLRPRKISSLTRSASSTNPRFCALIRPLTSAISNCLITPNLAAANCPHASSFSTRTDSTLSIYQPVRKLPPLCIDLKVVQFPRGIRRFAVVEVNRRSVQGFTKHLVGVVSECDDKGVRGHNGLRVVGLLRG